MNMKWNIPHMQINKIGEIILFFIGEMEVHHDESAQIKCGIVILITSFSKNKSFNPSKFNIISHILAILIEIKIIYYNVATLSNYNSKTSPIVIFSMTLSFFFSSQFYCIFVII